MKESAYLRRCSRIKLGSKKQYNHQKRRPGTQHTDSERHVVVVSDGKIILFLVSLLISDKEMDSKEEEI